MAAVNFNPINVAASNNPHLQLYSKRCRRCTALIANAPVALRASINAWQNDGAIGTHRVTWPPVMHKTHKAEWIFECRGHVEGWRRDGAVLEVNIRDRGELLVVAPVVLGCWSHQGSRRQSSTVRWTSWSAHMPLSPVIIQAPVPVLGGNRCGQFRKSGPRLPVATKHRRAHDVHTRCRPSDAADPQDPAWSRNRRSQFNGCTTPCWTTAHQRQWTYSNRTSPIYSSTLHGYRR